MGDRPVPAGRVFVSYRHDDTVFVVGHLVDRLEAHFGPARIFRDLDSIPYGRDYRAHIRDALDGCAAALVVIGPDWHGPDAGGGQRIDDPADLVRIEVETALHRGVPVIPVLTGEDVTLGGLELPGDLGELRFRNATRLRRDPDFDHDVARIVAALESHLEPEPEVPSHTEQLATLRRRLVTADRPELERIGYEARSLAARHPHDPDVQQFADQVARAQAPPAPMAAGGPPGMPVPSRRFPQWARVAAVTMLLVGGLGLVATVMSRAGEDSDLIPPGTDPVPADTCDRLSVDLVEVDPVTDSLDGGRYVRVVLSIANGGDAVALPGGMQVSFVDDTDAQIGVELPSGPGPGWFEPFDLAGGTRIETFVETAPDWFDRGGELVRIRIPDVHPVDRPFDRCVYDQPL